MDGEKRVIKKVGCQSKKLKITEIDLNIDECMSANIEKKNTI